MHAPFLTLWLQVVQPPANVYETKWTPHVKRETDVAQSYNSSEYSEAEKNNYCCKKGCEHGWLVIGMLGGVKKKMTLVIFVTQTIS